MGKCCECGHDTFQRILGVYICIDCYFYDYKAVFGDSLNDMLQVCLSCAYVSHFNRFDYIICKECPRKEFCKKNVGFG